MRVFLDTEFTDLANPLLISAALVAEDGREFYCELADGWRRGDCTWFVLDTVLPLLGQVQASTRYETRTALAAWLASLGPDVTLVSDYTADWHLVAALLGPRHAADIPWQLLSWPGSAMARRHDELREELLGNDPDRHHALVDAWALRRSVLQTEMEFS